MVGTVGGCQDPRVVYDPFEPGPHAVRARTLQLTDGVRAAACELWSPDDSNGRPLVVFSHLSGGTRLSSTFLRPVGLRDEPGAGGRVGQCVGLGVTRDVPKEQVQINLISNSDRSKYDPMPKVGGGRQSTAFPRYVPGSTIGVV
jgi:hypothetical protein